LTGHIGNVRNLLRLGVDVNAIYNGCPLIHWACYHQHAKVLELLLTSGAHADARDCDDQTALHVTFHSNARSKSLR
jgi:ankyrin repeat protein